MPFQSKAQAREMFANQPEIAKRWAKETPNFKDLPEKVDEESKKKKGPKGLSFVSDAEGNPPGMGSGDAGMGEANVASMGKGFAGPGGAMVRREFDPNNPKLKEKLDLIQLIKTEIASMLPEEDFEEVLRRHGNQWQVQHPDTEVVVGTYDNREQAREANRIFNKRVKREKDFKKSYEKSRDFSNIGKSHKPKPHEKLDEARLYNEEITDFNENEQGLSQDAVLSDPKLHALVKEIKEKEIKILELAFKKIKEKLTKSAWKYEILDKKAFKTPENRVNISFGISLPKTKTKVEGLVLKLECGKPIIELPEQIKNMLRQLNNDEAKYLRAELLHLNEEDLEKLNTIAILIAKRDKYLAEQEKELDEYVSQLTMLEVALLRKVLNTKYRGIK